MTGSELSIRGIEKRYGDVVAVQRFNLEIEAGQFVVLLGPSGSGKTTMLSILGGFVPASAGAVLFGGKDITYLPPAKRPTTTVFQDYALFPHMSVASNVAFGLAMRKVPARDRAGRVEAALKMVDLADYGNRKIHQLSGGQRQRVALARALVVNPGVLLLDEPLGALDLNLRRQMQEELKSIQQRLGTTFIHVTHDQEEALNIADVIVVMNEGRIEDVGPPEQVYMRPKTRFAATFLGRSNLLDARVVSVSDGVMTLDTGLGRFHIPGDGRTGDTAALSIRPEHLLVDAQDADSVDLGRAVIAKSAFNGTHYQCHARAGAQSDIDLTLTMPQRSHPVEGTDVRLSVRSEDFVFIRD